MSDTVYAEIIAPVTRFIRYVSVRLWYGIFGAPALAPGPTREQASRVPARTNTPTRQARLLEQMLAPETSNEYRHEIACWFTGLDHRTGVRDHGNIRDVPRNRYTPRSIVLDTEKFIDRADTSKDVLSPALSEAVGVSVDFLISFTDEEVEHVLLEHLRLEHLDGEKLVICGVPINPCMWLVHIGKNRVATAYIVDRDPEFMYEEIDADHTE